MRDLLDQIRKALEVDLYYLALFVALALPDICGAIGSSDGNATGQKYAAWFDKYVGPKYGGAAGQHLTGGDCYLFRCSLLHQGSSQHAKSRYSRYLFVEPAAAGSRLIMHNNVMNDTLNIDVRIFCEDMVQVPLAGWRKLRGQPSSKRTMTGSCTATPMAWSHSSRAFR
jgi:hypothetical protein